jgi:hypothetical protein
MSATGSRSRGWRCPTRERRRRSLASPCGTTPTGRWYDAIDAEAIGSCYPQRAEFLYSARHAAENDEIAEMFSDLYPDVVVPKTAGRWISSVQYQMARGCQALI